MDSGKLSTCVLGKYHHHHRHRHHPSKHAITRLNWGSISPVLARLRHFYRDHHHHHHHHQQQQQQQQQHQHHHQRHHHHHHHHHLRKDQKIWITTKILIFTKGFKRIECGYFLSDHAGFHEHNEPRVVLYNLWHDIINSHKVTKHACTFSWLPLATQYTTYTITLQ